MKKACVHVHFLMQSKIPHERCEVHSTPKLDLNEIMFFRNGDAEEETELLLFYSNMQMCK